MADSTEDYDRQDVAVAPPPRAMRVRRAARSELGQLWASVFFAPTGRIPKTVMVTAAERREGATQIGAGLAVVGAESNSELRIILVDFNLHHPRLDKLLKVSNTVGLSEVILGEATLEEAIQWASPPNLGVLTAGRRLDQPLGLLKSERLSSVLGELQGHASVDHVILDAAAANLYPEAQTLASLVDGVILVAYANVTRRESAAEAKKRIEQNGGRLQGVVLNQRRYAVPRFLYRRL